MRFKSKFLLKKRHFAIANSECVLHQISVANYYLYHRFGRLEALPRQRNSRWLFHSLLLRIRLHRTAVFSRCTLYPSAYKDRKPCRKVTDLRKKFNIFSFPPTLDVGMSVFLLCRRAAAEVWRQALSVKRGHISRFVLTNWREHVKI